MLCFVWIVYCTKLAELSAALSAIVTAASAYLIYKLQCGAQRLHSGKKSDAKQIAALGQYLRYGDNTELVCEMLRYFGFEVLQADPDDITVQKRGAKSLVALRFACDCADGGVWANAVVKAKRIGCEKLYMFAQKSQNAPSPVCGIQTTFVDVANVYALLCQCDKLPALPAPEKHRTSLLPQVAFCRKRFGWYLAAALFMLAISAVSFVKWYTLLWATVNMVLALYSLLNRRYNVRPTAVTLD